MQMQCQTVMALIRLLLRSSLIWVCTVLLRPFCPNTCTKNFLRSIVKCRFFVQVLYNIALVEIHEDDKSAAEDTLHQALNDSDVGQRQHIQQALDLLEVNGLS